VRAATKPTARWARLHKMLGMSTHLTVAARSVSPLRSTDTRKGRVRGGHEMAMGHDEDEHTGGARMMKVAGGGPVIQILPGPFPFADSAMAIIRNRPRTSRRT